MIISCPNCGAKYQVAVGVVMRRPKMKCAVCSHRWVPADEIDEDEAIAAVQEEARAARNPPLPEPEQESEPPEPEAEPEPERRGGTLLKWLVTVTLGAAFATAALGLWVGRIDPAALPGQLPIMTDLFDRFAPPAPALDVAVEGRLTRLPGGNALLEVTGTITNTGSSPQPVPPMAARLLVNGARVRDWTIPPPAASVAPGKRLAFASSLTDVPAGPVTVEVRFSR